jgi:hypothetical protein
MDIALQGSDVWLVMLVEGKSLWRRNTLEHSLVDGSREFLHVLVGVDKDVDGSEITH